MYKDRFVFEVHPCAYKQLLPQLVPSGLKQCSAVAASTDELYESLAIIFATPILFHNTESNILTNNIGLLREYAVLLVSIEIFLFARYLNVC